MTTRTKNQVTRQLWRFLFPVKWRVLTFPHYKFAWPRELKTRLLGNFEGFLTICQKTVFENNFSAAVFSRKCVKTKNTSSCLIYSIESSKVTRLVYLGDNAMFVNERLFRNTSVFSEKPTHPVFCHLWLRTVGLTCFGVCERSQQDVCRMIVTASSVLSPTT